MKTIIWQNSIHILGPNTSIDIGDAAIQIRSQANLVILSYADSMVLSKRYKEDEQFRTLLSKIIMRHLVEFLTTDKMAVLDLVTSVLKTQIVVEPVPTSPSENSNLAVGMDNAR